MGIDMYVFWVWVFDVFFFSFFPFIWMRIGRRQLSRVKKKCVLQILLLIFDD